MPGTTVRFADIRYAAVGIDVLGGPIHSPLLGEVSETNPLETVSSPTDQIVPPINLGSLSNTDRNALSVAGRLASDSDVDWYRFTVTKELSSRLVSQAHQGTTFDIDYADGLGRPDTSLWVFRTDNAGNPVQLVLIGGDSDITDDKPAPNLGTNASDITRGSFGSGDAYIGSVELPSQPIPTTGILPTGFGIGNYIIAVTNRSLTASALAQFYSASANGQAANEFTRLEPIETVQRIAEDRFDTGTPELVTYLPPKQVAFTNAETNSVPYTLADLTTYVVRTSPNNPNVSQLVYGNAMTGAKEAEGGPQGAVSGAAGTFTGLLKDVAVSPAGRIVGPAGPNPGPVTDGNSTYMTSLDRFMQNGASVGTGIQTFEAEVSAVGPPPTYATDRPFVAGARNGVGTLVTAVAFTQASDNSLALFGVGQRADGQPFDKAIVNPADGNTVGLVAGNPTSTAYKNILYRFDTTSFQAMSPPDAPDRTAGRRATGTGTQTREYGVFAQTSTYSWDRNNDGGGDRIVVTRQANGDIVGLAQVGNVLYGVTGAGELWSMQMGDIRAGFERGATLVSSTIPTGLTGLTKGPRDLESGAYANMLFGVTADGTLHAFSTTGARQRIFPGGLSSTKTATGADSISNSGSDVTGIDFAALDVNLWHTTKLRETDDGHGTPIPFNNSRDAVNGSNSLYFGFRDNNATEKQQGDWSGIYNLGDANVLGLDQSYNLPGGAKGAMESNAINLKGYTADDQPTLYFNYYSDTRNVNSLGTDTANMLDAVRVYGYSPQGYWILLGTNNSASSTEGLFQETEDEYDVLMSRNRDAFGKTRATQELYDVGENGSGSWRQARIDLAPLAGMEDTRLRFEFSTSGDFRTGDPIRGGIELNAISGDRIVDRDTFSLADVNTGAGYDFRFFVDNTGADTSAFTAINVTSTMTAAQVRNVVRRALARAINGDAVGSENVRAYPIYSSTVRVYNVVVIDSGPLQATTSRSGDFFGPYGNTAVVIPSGETTATKDFDRALQQGSDTGANTGIFIDDIIIGFAERGETVINSSVSTGNQFVATPFYEKIGGTTTPFEQTSVERGVYQLEIRNSYDYGLQNGNKIAAGRTIDTNDRLAEQVSLVVSETIDINDGDIFTVSDGVNVATFEFDMVATPGVRAGNIPVVLNLPYTSAKANSGLVAQAMRDAINGTVAQALIKITASVRGQMKAGIGGDLQKTSDNVVDLFGPAASDLRAGRDFSDSANLGTDAITEIFYAAPSYYGEDTGDGSRERDQGQLVLFGNSIRNSSGFGISVNAASPTTTQADFAGRRPYPGAVRNLVTENTDNLTPGVVIVNNILANNASGGLALSGQDFQVSAANGTPPISVARVVNNTIYGGATPTGTGISLTENVSPTLINNIISNTNVGISATNSTAVLGGNVFKNNNQNLGGIADGSFTINLGLNAPLFASTTNGKFYPAAGSLVIDSSLASLGERPGITFVKASIGQSPNPIIAPLRDAGGLLRVDDPSANTPVGQGQSVFIDRGAVDRSDFEGPIAQLLAPRDYFEVLIDDEGTGPDPASISEDSVQVTENGRLLTAGIDYEFGYSFNSRTIRLTPLSGFWRQDSVYEITLNNKPSVLIDAPSGIDVLDGDLLVGTTVSASQVKFEYDSGFSIRVPRTTRLLVPGAGSGTNQVADGQTFTITNGATTRVFEFDSNNALTNSNNVRVTIATNSSATAVRSAILTALTSTNAASLNLSPSLIGTNGIHLGVTAANSVDVSASGLGVEGVSSGLVDGDSFNYRSGANGTPKRFEFNTGAAGAVAANSVEIRISAADTDEAIAVKIAAALQNRVSGGLAIPQSSGDGLVYVGGSVGDALLSTSTLTISGAPGVATGNIAIPFLPLSSYNETRMAAQIISIVNGLPASNNLKAVSLGGSDIRISGLTSINGITNQSLIPIVDLAGNELQPNRPTGLTQFTVVMPQARVDFGDLFSLSVPTLLAEDGARHVIFPSDVATLQLGSRADSEVDGFPTADASGDDLNVGVSSTTTGDDEDGITFTGTFNQYADPVIANVQVTGTGFIDAWIDWNGDGDFDDVQEKVIDSEPVFTGLNKIDLGKTPSFAADGSRISRFRLSTTGGLSPSGIGVGGEVEDYIIRVIPGAPPIALNKTYSVNEDNLLTVVAPGLLNGSSDPDGQSVLIYDADDSTSGTIDPVSGPANGTLTLQSNGSFTYRPDADFVGQDSFTFRVTDGILRSLQAYTAVITVNPINDRPQFTTTVTNITVAEDTTVTPTVYATAITAGPVTAVDELPGGVNAQTVSFLVTNNNTSLFASQPTIASDGKLRYSLAPDQAGVAKVTVTLQDDGSNTSPNRNSSVPVTFTITVTEVNDKPTVPTQTATTNEDTSTSFTAATLLTSADAGGDEIGQTVRIRSVNPTSARGGTITPVMTGGFVTSFTYTPKLNFAGQDTIIYTIEDNGTTNGISDPQQGLGTIVVTVNPINDPPVFTTGGNVIVEEDTGAYDSQWATNVQQAAGTLQSPDNDDELNQNLSFQILSNTNASLFTTVPSIDSQGVLHFVTKPNAVGSAVLKVVAVDSGSNIAPNSNRSTTATFTIQFTEVNDPPIPGVINKTVLEDNALTITGTSIVAAAEPGPATATDEASQIITLSGVTQRSLRGGSVVLSAGNIVYRPAANFVGTDEIVYTIRDNGTTNGIVAAQTAQGTITVQVDPVNDPPRFTPGAAVDVNEDSAAYRSAWATNIAPGPTTALDEASQSVSFQILGNTNTALFTVQPTLNTLGVLSFTPAANANGIAVLRVIASDSGSGNSPDDDTSAEVLLTITIDAINDAPVFTSGGNITVAEDSGDYSETWATKIEPAAGLLLTPPQATDEAAQTITFTITNSNTDLFSSQPVIDASGILKFTPAANAYGQAILVARARDSGSGTSPNVNQSTTKTFTVTVTSVNDAPIGSPDTYNANEDVLLNVTTPTVLVNDSDVDNDGTTVDSITAVNATNSILGATVVMQTNGRFTYDPRTSTQLQAIAQGATLLDTFTYRVKDLAGALSAPVTVTVTVTGVNDAPNAVDDQFFVPFNTTSTLNVLANDTDVDSTIVASTVEVSLVPSSGTATVQANGTISYRPNTGFRGSDSFAYRVRDNLGALSREATVTVTMNSAPTVASDSVQTTKNAAIEIDVLDNDHDPNSGDTIAIASLRIESVPTNGTAEILSNGNIRYTPTNNYLGRDSFTYSVADNLGLRSGPATVSINVVTSLYQNPTLRYDVNNDGYVSPIDALLIINYLNRRPAPPPLSTTLPNYLDVDGNNVATPTDIIQVINFINRRGNNVGGEGEFGTGVTTVGSTALSAVPAIATKSVDVEVLPQSKVIDYEASKFSVKLATTTNNDVALMNNDAWNSSDDVSTTIDEVAGSNDSARRRSLNDTAFVGPLDDLFS